MLVKDWWPKGREIEPGYDQKMDADEHDEEGDEDEEEEDQDEEEGDEDEEEEE